MPSLSSNKALAEDAPLPLPLPLPLPSTARPSRRPTNDDEKAKNNVSGVHRGLLRVGGSQKQKKQMSTDPPAAPAVRNTREHRSPAGLAQGFANEKFRPEPDRDNSNAASNDKKSELFLDDSGSNSNSNSSLVVVEDDAGGVSSTGIRYTTTDHHTSTVQDAEQSVQQQQQQHQYAGESPLVEAVLVVFDEEDGNNHYSNTNSAPSLILEARPTRWTDILLNRYVMYLVVVMVLVFIAMVVVVNVVIGWPGGKDDDGDESTAIPLTLRPSENPSAAPTTDSLRASLQTLLAPHTVDSTFNTEHTALPQAQAFQWLLLHPELESMTSSRTLQLFGLTSLYYATNGTNWEPKGRWFNQWLNYSIHECEWGQYHSGSIHEPTVICNEEDGMYHTLWLEHSNLQGTIPSQISLLSALEFLHCSDNFLIGSLPDEIFRLDNLKALDLHDNSLSSTLSTSVGNLKSITDLQLYNNMFTGTLPTELGLLTTMLVLSLTSNKLSGTIPEELSKLMEIYSLMLSTNKLEGTISSTIGRLTKLEKLIVPENLLTSTLPTELGLLTSITELSFTDNSIRGNIPSELGLLTDLFYLTLNSNALGGSIPSTLANLTALETLFLQDNIELFGPIPLELCKNAWGSPEEWWRGLVVDCSRVNCLCDDCRCGDNPT